MTSSNQGSSSEVIDNLVLSKPDEQQYTNIRDNSRFDDSDFNHFEKSRSTNFQFERQNPNGKLENSRRLSQILQDGKRKSINSVDIEINENYTLNEDFEKSSSKSKLEEVNFNITPVVQKFENQVGVRLSSTIDFDLSKS